MMYGNMPLYPGMPPEDGACVKVPLFDGGHAGPPRPPVQACKRVALENPRCPGEWVEVLLGVDACGSLTVCVHREPDCRPAPPCRPSPSCRPNPPCCLPPRPPEPRRCCPRGRLYGSW